MKTLSRFRLIFFAPGLSFSAAAQSAFAVIPLGVRGGLDEGNLSSYLVAAGNSRDYICLDAGTLYAGIRKAIANGVQPPPCAACPW